MAPRCEWSDRMGDICSIFGESGPESRCLDGIRCMDGLSREAAKPSYSLNLCKLVGSLVPFPCLSQASSIPPSSRSLGGRDARGELDGDSCAAVKPIWQVFCPDYGALGLPSMAWQLEVQLTYLDVCVLLRIQLYRTPCRHLMPAHFVGLKRGDGEQQRLIPQLACIRDRSGGHPPPGTTCNYITTHSS